MERLERREEEVLEIESSLELLLGRWERCTNWRIRFRDCEFFVFRSSFEAC